MNTSREEQQLRQFQDLIDQCASLLSTMDTLQLNALIERFSAEIDSKRTLNYLVDGPSLLSCLISRHIVRPDNLTALIAMAEVADRSDIKQSIDNYYPQPRSSNQSNISLTDDGNFNIGHYQDNVILITISISIAFMIVSSNIQHDWRNLARQLALAELDIARINASNSDNQSAASQVTILKNELFKSEK